MTTEAPTLDTLRALEAFVSLANERIAALEERVEDAIFALAYVEVDGNFLDRQGARLSLSSAESRLFDAQQDRSKALRGIETVRAYLRDSGTIFTF